MHRKKLSEKLTDKSNFVVIAELTGGPGFDFAPIGKFLSAYKAGGSGAPGLLPAGFDFTAVALPENPGGAANIEPSAVLNYLEVNDLLADLDFIPHVSCKDANADGIVSSLISYRNMEINSVLALTGDKPIKAKAFSNWIQSVCSD